MSYVPIVPYVPPPQASPRARRLAVELEESLEAFEAEQGPVSGEDLHQALSIVRASRRDGAPQAAVTVGLVLALVLGGGVALLAFAKLGGLSVRPAVAGALLGLLAAGLGVYALAAARRR